jgi:hypothetical protein
MEAVKQNNQIVLTVDGAAGLRTLNLTGNWQIDPNSASAPSPGMAANGRSITRADRR